MNKKCMKCSKPASYKFVKIEGNQIYDMFFCADHAAEASPHIKKTSQAASVSQILANLLMQEQAAQVGSGSEPGGAVCKSCGLSFDGYRKTLILGCGDCYESFFEQLLPELHKFHRATKHVGRKPGGGLETSEPERRLALPSALPEEILPSDVEGEIEEVESVEAEPDPMAELAQLSEAMQAAIEAEDFEAAARLRDRIKNLRESLKG